ncbi:hypothetical protein [Allokutzneria albata]|uniref:Bacteriocin biosynthesis cyclodehydratase domain-containing protein n=1 Tax=Allokutzneria albata TaxID=211114 RepID=A0A1G9YE59_ALLAB|nr:hypothetical protein [Allokutzneria albata]SDN07382.1 hypothetical protein SAMN04489726_4770 [Allokutzneria albata]
MTSMTTATPAPALPRPLPQRPRLLPGLPVLWRGDGTVQIGLDPRHAVVVDRLSPDLVRVLRELDGRHTLQGLLDLGAQDGTDASRSEVAGLLSALAGAGVLDRDSTGSSTAAQREPPPGLITDAGVWALRTGRACADILAERGRSTVHVHGSGRVGDALVAMLRSAGMGTVRRIAKRSRSVPDFAVLIGPVLQDHQLRTALMADSVPHLAVEPHEVSAHIGPFVIPGRTSCLTCLDLRRCERDPAWGLVSSQLGNLCSPEELICAHGAAVVAAGQVLMMLSHSGGVAGVPPTWNGAIELDPVRGKAFLRALPPRPGCGCGVAEGGSAYM